MMISGDENSFSNNQKEYKLRYLSGCTGVCQYLIDINDTIPFQFSDNSDKKAIESLQALRGQVFILNTSRENLNLTVIGHLAEKKSMTEGGKHRSEVEEFYEFKLNSWYLTPPILYADIDEIKELPIEYEIKSKRQLDLSDFIGLKLSTKELSSYLKEDNKEGALKN